MARKKFQRERPSRLICPTLANLSAVHKWKARNVDTTGARDFFDYELTRIKTNFLMLRGNALFAPLVAKIKLVPSRVAQYRFLECARERVPARFLFLLSKRKSFLCYYKRA